MSPEEMSFRNLVAWHRDDLVKIMNGALATKTFTENHHEYLVKYGVLHRDPTINRTLPTPEARSLLEDQPSLPSTTEGEK